ncbi:MAG: RIP metalloprotease RseP [Pseudomonadota bacterium]
MEFLDAIPVIGPVLGVAVPFLVVLAVVVFVHEYGHYIVGRWCGIQAEVFSIGFGKRLYSWTDKRGTRWQVAALPLGGYVKFVGDMDPASANQLSDDQLSEEQKAVAFHNAPLLARTAAVAAGPFANFLLSILLFAALFLASGQSSDEPVIADLGSDATAEIGFQAGDRVLRIDGVEIESFGQIVAILHRSNGREMMATIERVGITEDVPVRYNAPPRIDSITPGQAASRAGITPGDQIISIDGKPVTSFYDMQLRMLEIEPDTPVAFEVLRNGTTRTLDITPEMITRAHPETGEEIPQPTLGVRLASQGGLEPLRVSVSPWLALYGGVLETWAIITGTLAYFGDMLFADADTSQLGGPLRIAEMSGDTAAQGINAFLRLIAVLSTSIGLLNLLPIPVLDGGHLMFYAVEAVRGRPLAGSWMQIGAVIGLSLVLSLMVFATYNDISRYFAG